MVIGFNISNINSMAFAEFDYLLLISQFANENILINLSEESPEL